MRVETARGCQRERFSASDDATCNADKLPAVVRQCCALDDSGRMLMKTVMS
jgi:predicted ATPase with chaperone activity